MITGSKHLKLGAAGQFCLGRMVFCSTPHLWNLIVQDGCQSCPTCHPWSIHQWSASNMIYKVGRVGFAKSVLDEMPHLG